MGPLEGIRILDLTSMVSGPVAAMILADQGADVIKVEPLRGEQMRHLGEKHNGVSATFYSCNRNKRSLALNLKTEQGAGILWKLIEDADVLIQNFRPGAMERMGFGESKVRECNSGIIYVSISGFGEQGPYSHKRVYDPLIQALSGATDIQADRHTARPAMFRIILADKVSALTAAQAVSAALFHRERSGEGQHIELSMLEATIAFLWPEGMGGLVFAENESASRNRFSSLDLVYETRDGYITLSTISDAEWRGLCEALERSDLSDDERFSTALARRKHAALRREIVGAEVEKFSSEEVLALLDEQDVPCAPLLTRNELLDHPQIVACDSIVRDELPGFGEVRQARPAAHFSATESSIRSPAPKLGEHTKEILNSLAYSSEEFADLVDNEVVRTD